MYDLIVIGDDLSSHAAAAYASHHGLNTLLIAESGLGGLQLIGDFVFNLDASPLTGLGTDQQGHSMLSELDIIPPKPEALSINPAYQIILPGHRIDFYNDLNSLKAELSREFPEWDADISDYYDAAVSASSAFQNWMMEHPLIQPQNLREYFSYLKMFPQIFRYKFSAVKFDKILSQNISLEKAWEAQQALLSFNNSDLFSFASAFQHCAPMRGVSCLPQGRQFLFNALIEKIESRKGLYLSRYEIMSINTGRSSIELEIKAKDGAASKVSARHLIISVKSDKLSLLQDSNQSISFSDRLRPAKITYYPFTLFLGVTGKCLPEKMARHTAVVPDVNKDIHDHNLIILEACFQGNNREISEARVALTATIYLPVEKERWTVDALRKEGSTMVDRLEDFLPFLRDNIEQADIDQSINISLDYRQVVNPKYNVRNALFTSFAAKSNKTHFKNIFLTGSSLLSDAGFDADMISGRNAAMQVIRMKG